MWYPGNPFFGRSYPSVGDAVSVSEIPLTGRGMFVNDSSLS